MLNLHFVLMIHICMDVAISFSQISIYRHDVGVVQYLNIVSRRRHSGFSVPISPISPCISLYHSVALVSIFFASCYNLIHEPAEAEEFFHIPSYHYLNCKRHIEIEVHFFRSSVRFSRHVDGIQADDRSNE